MSNCIALKRRCIYDAGELNIFPNFEDLHKTEATLAVLKRFNMFKGLISG